MSEDLCGCGKPVRYTTTDGRGACNKYGRCPTYEELSDKLADAKADLHVLKERISDILNAREVSISSFNKNNEYSLQDLAFPIDVKCSDCGCGAILVVAFKRERIYCHKCKKSTLNHRLWIREGMALHCWRKMNEK